MIDYSYTRGKALLCFEEFATFIRRVEHEFVPPLLARIDLADYFQKISQHAKQIVCRYFGEAVGVLCLYDNDTIMHKGYITFLAVSPSHRGMGIASKLLATAEREAADNGMADMNLHTGSDKAREFYLKNGYKMLGAEARSSGSGTCYHLTKLLKKKPMNILLTSAGRRTYIVDYFKEALAGKGLVHASNSVMTYTLTQADRHVITPSIYDEGYIGFLLDYCTKNQISAILSLFDIDLPILAAHRQCFEQAGVRLVLSDERVTHICNDKWRTYTFLREIGLPQANSYLSLAEAKAALQANEILYPLIVKPRWGMGSIGIYQAETEEELDVFYDKIKRDIFKTYLRFESRADENACVMIQEKIEGQEYGLDVLNDLNGRYVTTIAKKKLAMRAGETDVAEIVDNCPFEAIGRKLAESLGHVANLDVDCFLTESRQVYVLELNCRFGGQYPFSHLAGVNFPKQIIAWLEGMGTDTNLVTPTAGIVSAKELTPVVICNKSSLPSQE